MVSFKKIAFEFSNAIQIPVNVRKWLSTSWYFYGRTKYRKMYSRNWAPNMKIFPNQIHFWI